MRGWASRRAIMSEPAAEIAHQFVDAGQQRDAATFGMWIFLCTEVLLFERSFLAIPCIGCRTRRPSTKRGAYAHRGGLDQYGHPARQQLLRGGGGPSCRARRPLSGRALLCAAALLGVLFLAVKAYSMTQNQEGFFPGQSFHFSGPHSQGLKCFLFFTSR